jgi:hypothetical protein
MKLLSLAGLIVVGAMVMPAPAVAAPVGGDSEVQISGGAFHAQGSDTGAFNANLSYGYFFNPVWELGIRQGINYTFRDKASDFWTATTTPFMHFHLPLGIFVPYLGGGIGAAYNDRDITGVIGPDAGVKIFFNPQTFLNLGYRYEYFFSKFKDVDNNSNHGNHIGAIGIGFVWGGTRTTK